MGASWDEANCPVAIPKFIGSLANNIFKTDWIANHTPSHFNVKVPHGLIRFVFLMIAWIEVGYLKIEGQGSTSKRLNTSLIFQYNIIRIQLSFVVHALDVET